MREAIVATAMRSMIFPLVVVLAVAPCRAVDNDGDQLSDVWEMVFSAGAVLPGADTDGDGFTNGQESLAGTDPFSVLSYPDVELEMSGPSSLLFEWEGRPGKRYTLMRSATLAPGSWTEAAPTATGAGGMASLTLTDTSERRFYQLNVADSDTDGDGATDWEERMLGFDPGNARTERLSQQDGARIGSNLNAANTVVVSVYDDSTAERWPEPATFAIRRSGGMQPFTVNLSFAGSATRDVDYSTGFAGTTVSLAPGQREAFVNVTPIQDSEDGESDETVTLTVLPGAGYSVGAVNSGSVTIANQTATSGPSAKEAARFLTQASFGPDQDSADDADQIPENVETLMGMGIEAWIDDQFTRPIGPLTPFVTWAQANANSMQIYSNWERNAWWGRVMELPRLRPDATQPQEQAPDPLRQRVTFALSEIFVISDRLEAFANEPFATTNYYDMLMSHAFGNYRDLLLAVSLHPSMGMYLSHLGNRKPDPVNGVFPDENYAREIMQLFSIGLWMLNADGTRQLDGQGNPIPTYDNGDITEFARIFTGLSFGQPGRQFFTSGELSYVHPMAGWDAEHDLNPKTLLTYSGAPNGGLTLARTASPGRTGTATMADVNAAIDNLFHHPNVGPFLGRLLIQRLVTSNPSPSYVASVAAAFADNGSGVRGDMKAVIKAILMNPEARSYAMTTNPHFGKLREPLLKCVNLARAFNAKSQEGWYYLDLFVLDHFQDVLNSPSVFNFFLPSYSPPGAITQAGLVAPEFQIINATSVMSASNYFWDHGVLGGLHRWGAGQAVREVRLNVDQEMALNHPSGVNADPGTTTPGLNPDPLIRRLDMVLTGGTLSPRQFQVIRESLARVGPGSGWDWPRDRLNLAVYGILNSADFAVQR